MAYYRDVHEYIEALESEGLLVRVKRPINKDTEMHPLVRWQFRGLAEEQRRAFLFEKVVDAHGKEYAIPVLIGGLAGSQRIYNLGLQCGSADELAARWAGALQSPVDPVLVKEGPVREVILKGPGLLEHGGLEALPIPISTPGLDNAPYLTAGCWITKDPGTGARNMAIYRGQLKGPLKTGCGWTSARDSTAHWEKCRKKGVPLEAAVVIGGPPCIAYAAVQKVPLGVDELALAGGLAQQPIELVKCETIDLEVPAHAEIVIEGRIPTDYLEPDAPFGESHGYGDPGDLTVVFGVTAITHRRNPVFVSIISQLTPSESSKIKQSAYENFSIRYLTGNLGLPATRVALCEDLLNRQMIVIQMKKQDPQDPWKAMEGLIKTRIGGKILVCVDPDIAPSDLLSVMWAIANRSQPHRHVKIVPNRPLPWNPIRYVADGERYDVTDSSILIDATLKAELPPVALPARQYMERAKALWEELGLPELNPRPPWHGYSLGYWPEEARIQAENAAAGDYKKNSELIAAKGVRLSRSDQFEEVKTRNFAAQFEKMKQGG